jgi:hypothetical protein
MLEVMHQIRLKHILAYFLKARTAEAKKQPLLSNGPYTRSRGTCYVRCDVSGSTLRIYNEVLTPLQLELNRVFGIGSWQERN